MTYDDLLRELFPRLTGGIRWGLDRTERMLASVGDPQRTFRALHVGGTNGKGSVAALIASTLSQSGLRTGLYTSPHLCTFRERIQVDGKPVSESALLAAAERLWPAVEAERPSFFEATTALAFLVLAEAGVRTAVVEVGLGGRLDATNIIVPEVAVLTNVALDHIQLLGDTIEAVAREKAGIIKTGKPTVCGWVDPVARRVFERTARERGAPISFVPDPLPDEFATGIGGTTLATSVVPALFGDSLGEAKVGRRPDLADDGAPLWSPLPGAHQARNMALAVAALHALPLELRPPLMSVRAGFAAVRWPGRLQVERVDGRTWIFDVAHNLAGVDALAAALPLVGPQPPVVALIGVLGDKDWRAMLRPLYAAADRVVLTEPVTAPTDRAWDPTQVLAEVPADHVEAVPAFAAALARARTLAGATGTILVTGSVYTVGDALAALGRAPFGADTGLQGPAFAA